MSKTIFVAALICSLFGGAAVQAKDSGKEKACRKAKAWDCYNMALEAEKGDRGDEARKLYAIACREKKVTAACYNQGINLMQAEEFAESKKYFKIACDTKEFEKSGPACYNAGYVSGKMGDAKEKKTYWKLACNRGVERGCADAAALGD